MRTRSKAPRHRRDTSGRFGRSPTGTRLDPPADVTAASRRRERLLAGSHDGAAHSDSFDGRSYRPSRFGLLDEFAGVGRAGIASLGHDHGVGIDTESPLQHAGPGQAIRHFEQAWLDAEN